MTNLDPALVARFAADLDRLVEPETKLGIAISGGPDSVALLLLSAAARPGLVEAATVDHGLRPEARAEAEWVADLCRSIAVPHAILSVSWNAPPATAIQERARAVRYDQLGAWMRERGLTDVCTGHHRDDQAETLLMRLARGAGVRGLAGMRPSAPLPGHPDLTLLRPLLSRSRMELQAICAAAGVEAVDDPSNRDANFERVRVRAWMAEAGIEAEELARSARHLRQADEAIEWATDHEWSVATTEAADGIDYRRTSVPDEIRRRVVARAIARLASEGDPHLRGSELDRLIEKLGSGGVGTLRGVRCEGGETWRFRCAARRFGRGDDSR